MTCHQMLRSIDLCTPRKLAMTFSWGWFQGKHSWITFSVHSSPGLFVGNAIVNSAQTTETLKGPVAIVVDTAYVRNPISACRRGRYYIWTNCDHRICRLVNGSGRAGYWDICSDLSSNMFVVNAGRLGAHSLFPRFISVFSIGLPVNIRME